ncbi:unnamed protein product [Angiostrongylus costaricensis]|uniref:Protein export membrane protein SecD/SecF C-terminal domain-containing protein n=1 Tax=Angiostrongylus costaricensis TaxID=334426 RepID=A0A3P7HBW6_ANGCS|nr:unnamed protein product [Angiostrongylus costaricensis]
MFRRAIIASYPSFHVLSHHPFEKVPTESAASAPHNFIQTAVSAIVLMSFLVLLFVMNWEAIISVVISITSICLGIVAYLHLWGVRLDAVSLISILMSVGFSVDYSAHVCYHYFAHATEDQHEHMTERTMVRLSKNIGKSFRNTLRRLV